MSQKAPQRACITVQALSKSFHGDCGLLGWLGAPRVRSLIRALDRIGLEVADGQVFGLVGPNGAGKTTLLKILATLVLPSAGTAQIGGYDVVRQAREVRRQLGVMFELERSFYARLSGCQNLEFFAALDNLPRSQAQHRIRELTELLGLVEVGERRVLKYSAGMQHRLGLARALLPDPSVLLLDEPTRSLDPISALELRGLLHDELAHRQRKTILLASHSLAEVEQICDRFAVLNCGQIVAVGSRQELARKLNCTTMEEIYRKAIASADHGQNP